MKRFLFTGLLALALLAPALLAPASTAYAASTTKTTPAAGVVSSGVGQLRQVRAGSLDTQRLRPLSSACTHTIWIVWTSARTSYPDYVLQAEMWLLVSTSNHSIYCGAVQSEGNDHLLQNCHTFWGSVTDGWQSWSDFSVYHCSHLYYDFFGPISYPTCTSWVFYGQNGTETGDEQDTPEYTPVSCG